MSLLIIKRIAKSNNYYLIYVLDLVNKEILLKLLDRNSNIIIDDIFSIDEEFIDLEKNSIYDIKNLEKHKTEKIVIPTNLKIHRFDPSSVGIRKLNYSIYNIEENILFIPCCGKHIQHDEIKSLWGNYINNYDFLNYNIEGYLVNNRNIFDKFILGINDSILNFRFIGNSQFIIKEFFDYLGIEGSVETLQRKNRNEYILKIK